MRSPGYAPMQKKRTPNFCFRQLSGIMNMAPWRNRPARCNVYIMGLFLMFRFMTGAGDPRPVKWER